MANIKLEDEVTALLSQSTITDTLLVLPDGQLDRKLYEKVAKAINTAGGKWNRGKKGFTFDSDPRVKLGLALDTGVLVDEKKKRQAFYTPAAIADQVALLAGISGLHVLEPSCGDGALVAACLKFGAEYVDGVEIEESCVDKLGDLIHSVWIADFMALEPQPRYPRVVMNPPFTKGQYWKHVAQAVKWLAPGGKLFAIVPDNNCAKLAALGATVVTKFPAGAFKESGTNIATCLVTIERAEKVRRVIRIPK